MISLDCIGMIACYLLLYLIRYTILLAETVYMLGVRIHVFNFMDAHIDVPIFALVASWVVF